MKSHLTNLLPEQRRPLIQRLLSHLAGKKVIKAIEAHHGLSARIAEDAGYDAIWVSSLTETASRGLPDIELEGYWPRLELVHEILNVCSLPVIVDGDTGGTIDQFCHLVQELERMGVSAVVVEDKVFPKANSFDESRTQVLEDPDRFALKIRRGRQALRTQDFLLIARIETFIVGANLEDAIFRAKSYIEAGADGIVIHSKSVSPEEVFEFAQQYQRLDRKVPLFAIPTTYHEVKTSELQKVGFHGVIYANHLLRSSVFAMRQVAASILEEDRSSEVEDFCVPVKSLLNELVNDYRH